MKQTRLLFIDRDGTLIQEPADEQIDSFEKLVFTKGVFRNLAFIAQHTDYELVMAVSYTHLDVYKRQPASFSFLHRGCPTKDLPNNRNERKGYAYS